LAISPHVVTFGYGRTNDLWPFTLLDGARSFVAVADAAVVRLGRPDAGGPHYLTVLFLLSQAIENALKSNLLIGGVTEDELMKIGHDLPRVLVRTESAGWPTQHRADHFLLKVIDGCYRHQKQLQYHRAREMTLPLLRPVRELAHEYIGRHRRSSPNDEPVNASTAGWSIDPAADYGGPTLTQFREAAPPSGDLSDLTDAPSGKDDVTPS
jgi:hypothetical protein